MIIWKKRVAARNSEMFPSTLKINRPEIAQLILKHWDSSLINFDKYFSSISVDRYDWVRSP